MSAELHDDPPLASDAAVAVPPFTDDDLAEYAAVMEAGPNAELGPDGNVQDPELAAAVERAAHVGSWFPTDDAAAEWAMAKLVEAQAELAAIDAQHEAWVARYDDWRERVAKHPRRTVAFMQSRLEAYGVRVRDEDGAATVVLPSGTIKTTASSAVAEVDDDRLVARFLDVVLGDPPEDAPDEVRANYAAWHAAWEKLVEKADEPLVLVKRDPKVYLGPFRKLVHLGELTVGWRADAVMACGHVFTVHMDTEDSLDTPTVGELLTCLVCPGDPIDGPARQPVADVKVAAVKEPVVLGPDGAIVPGAVVKPPAITPKVVPGG